MQQLLNGVFIGSIYALFAIGFTLVFGILDRLNLAHPSVFAVSAFIGIELVADVGLSVWVALPIVLVVGAVLGLIIERLAFRPLKNRPDAHFAGLISSIALAGMFIALLQDESLPGRTFPALRTGIMAGAPCPIEVMRQVGDRLGARELTIAYGQTEASPVVTQTRTDDPIELRVETVGRPLPGVEVKVWDPATGRDLPDNEQGELCTRGHVVMLGYYKNEDATRAAIDADGWLHSGDLAVRLPNGYYKITGRLKDMVIRGGENIYPREIEEFLFTHPAVEQVSVVGLPDPKYGEELCAWIKLKAGASATEDQIRDFCRAKLAHYKVPSTSASSNPSRKP